MIDKIAKINKKFIALLMSVLILVSSVVVAYTVNAANTELEETGANLGFNNTFSLNSEGDAVALKAKFSVAKTDLKSGFAMAQSSIGGKNVYCLDMGNHPYSSDMNSDNENAWNKYLNVFQRDLIKNILVLGLEGTLKGSVIGTFNATNYSATARKGSYEHKVYKGDAYGLKGYKFTDSEIYIATQLLIWEVTNDYRKPSNPSYTSNSLLKGYWRDNVPSGESKGNSHIRAVYRFISERLSTINIIPEFAVDSHNLDNISNYSFKVTYDKNATNKYEITPSSRTLRTGNKNVLKHYKGLFKNKAYSYKNSFTDKIEYLNVKSEMDSNGNLKLTPSFNSNKEKPKEGYSVVSNGKSRYSSKEYDVPTGDDANTNINKGLDVNIIAYAPNGDTKAQRQVGVKPDVCTLDPRNAHFNVSVSFKDNTTYNRDFSIQKDMRIKSDTVASGESSNDLNIMESGYYFYITFPEANNSKNDKGDYTKEQLATVNNGKLVYQNTESQTYKKGIYYNSILKEYYTIVGPTDKNGVTGSVAESMKKYVDSSITEGSMPYGNYYIYELGRRTKNTSDTSAKAYMDVTNYEMPTGISSYYFTYQEHSDALIYHPNKTLSVSAKDSNGKSHNFTVKMRAYRDAPPEKENLVDYFSRLKRIYRGKTSLTEITPTNVNLVSVPIKFQKYSDDGVYKNVVFQIDRYDKNTKSWSPVDLFNMIKIKDNDDFNYKKDYLDKLRQGMLPTYSDKSTTDTDYGTEKLGYTPDIYFPTGKYRLTEKGTLNKSGNIEGLKPYVIEPDPYVFVIGDYSDDSDDDAVDIIDEFVKNNEVISYNTLDSVKVTIENLANLELRLFKTDYYDKTPLNGATYGLFNSKDNCIGEVETATNNINGKNCKGTAVFKGLSFDEEYYVKELEAPAGYELDTTKYRVESDDISVGSNAFDKMTFRNNFINYIDLNVEDKPREVPISKTDFSGKMLKGAKLWVYSKKDESIVNNYLNKYKNDTSKINENDPEIKNVLRDYWVSDDKPHTFKRFLESKRYVLREISPPDGYILSDSIDFKVIDNVIYYATVDSSGNTIYEPSSDKSIVMKDDSTKVAFDKVNEEGKSISGALLQVKDFSGKVVKEWTTDGKEYVLDGVLVAGATYTLHEVSAPNVEYELAKDISFKVGTDGVKQVITMKDNYKRGSVTVHKKDEKGNILTGAEFELYKEDGTKVTSTLVKEGSYTVGGSVGTYVVDSKGTFKIDKLRFGSYYLIETKAPEGRMPYGDKIKFTIKDDATLNLEFTVNDDNSVMMNTGGSGYTVPMTVGIAVLLVSILSLIYLKRRKYNSK